MTHSDLFKQPPLSPAPNRETALRKLSGFPEPSELYRGGPQCVSSKGGVPRSPPKENSRADRLADPPAVHESVPLVGPNHSLPDRPPGSAAGVDHKRPCGWPVVAAFGRVWTTSRRGDGTPRKGGSA